MTAEKKQTEARELVNDYARRLRNEVCLTSKLDWQEHVQLAREAADEIERLSARVEELEAGIRDVLSVNDQYIADAKPAEDDPITEACAAIRSLMDKGERG